jgi:hypothetical protein
VGISETRIVKVVASEYRKELGSVVSVFVLVGKVLDHRMSGFYSLAETGGDRDVGDALASILPVNSATRALIRATRDSIATWN